MAGTSADEELERHQGRKRPHGGPGSTDEAQEREDGTSGEDSKRQRALCSFQVKTAQRCRENLVNQWREVSRPRGAGAVAKMPSGARQDFPLLFAEWLEARSLGDALEHIEDRRSWAIYRYTREPVVHTEASWEVAFHGTWWYSVWLVLESGILLESNDHEKGHDFWEPGVYCSPNLETARWYARPHVLFGDGVYHRVVFELRVDGSQRKRNRQRGGIQWVFPTTAVALYAVWVQINSPPYKGEERVNEWDADLEALPPNCEQPVPIVNSRDGPWPQVEEEEEEDIEEEWLLPPHLAGAHLVRPARPETAVTRPGNFCRLRLPSNGAAEVRGNWLPRTADIAAVGRGLIPSDEGCGTAPTVPSAAPRARGSAALALRTRCQEPHEQAPHDKGALARKADAAAVHAALARMCAFAGAALVAPEQGGGQEGPR
eukprot:CAMPEP_0179068058 /NCGR_PEP_ID=MMETSP0796-20121207/29811_1 /TAXON_ID=73915 /ORGANISM="Pyrodinium bahamense, Strain pbaha01" /LENGTH=430 /DNA_ID=CAMNT_0020765111 /DNA_START=21 /DNA_END=1316 /DNA_ORIENTATION=+